MNLAFITAKFPFDGKEAFLAPEIDALAQRANITVIPATPRAHRHGHPGLHARIVRLGAFAPATAVSAVREFVRAPRASVDVLRRVLASNGSTYARVRNLLVFPKALATARLCRELHIDHVHAYWLSTPATVAYVVSELCGIPWSATGHRWDVASPNVAAICRERTFFETAHSLRTISNRARAQLLHALGLGYASRTSTIHLGVDVPKYAAAKTGAADLRIVCIGSLTHVKGHPYLFEALALARSKGLAAQCTLIGEGPLRERLVRLRNRLGLNDAVHFSGHLSHAEVRERLAAGRYDVAILPSIDEGDRLCEGIPVSLMEAMAARIPCIATRSGSVSELIDQRCGVLVAPGDSAALAGALLAMWRYPAVREALGDAARRKVQREFDVQTTAATFYRSFASAAESRSRTSA
ncbi:MAG: glycosyltransferase family 4 protein [Candidatus Eremiobacteraeota bacterium]|nr:glycosyltransferase family 4 protein [Candidatus Eremiobacteraeota bacterium]